MRKKKLINNTYLPQHAIETFARCVFPDICAFFNSEEGQREFALWQAEQANSKLHTETATATENSVAVVLCSFLFSWTSWLGLWAYYYTIRKIDLFISGEINK